MLQPLIDEIHGGVLSECRLDLGGVEWGETYALWLVEPEPGGQKAAYQRAEAGLRAPSTPAKPLVPQGGDVRRDPLRGDGRMNGDADSHLMTHDIGYLTSQQAAAYLQVSDRLIRREVAAGRLAV